jgi:hypothetical protein
MSNAVERKKKKFRNQIIIYSVLGVLAVGLILYLVFREEGRMAYDLPSVELGSTESITTIEIDGPDKTFRLKKTGDYWFIMPEKYRVDPSAVKGMLTALEEFRFTELISQAGYPARFNLDEASRTTITVYTEDGSGEGEEVFSIHAGKAAPSYKHTYVSLKDDERIFLAKGNLPRAFGKEISALRDKQVLSFDREGVKAVHITRRGETNTLRRVSAEETTETVWKDNEGRNWKTDPVNNLLDRLKDFQCTRYLEDDENIADTGEPFLVIAIKGETEEDILFLYEQREDKAYPARSSETPHAFIVSQYQGDAIKNFIDQAAPESE